MEIQEIVFDPDRVTSQHNLDFAEKVFTVFCLLFYIGVFSFGTEASTSPFLTEAVITLLRYITYAITLLLLIFRINDTLKTAFSNKWVLLLISFISISFLWSQDPSTTIDVIWKELFPMFFSSLYMASRFTLEQQFSLTIKALLITFFLSIFLAIAMPSIGVHQSGEYIGAWKGVFGDKNRFGANAAMGLIALFMLANYAEKRQRWAFILLFLYSAILMLSGSVTAFVLAIVGLLLTVFYQRFTWLGKKSVLLINLSVLTLASIFYVLLTKWTEILGFFDRDPTLSARTLIWNYIITSKIPAHPLLGYGKSVFWSSDRLTSGFEVAARHIPSHAHNGFLDLILEVGLIGFTIFLITWMLTYMRAIKLTYDSKKASFLWPTIFLSMLVLFNISESYLVLFVNLNWVLFIALALSLSRKPFFPVHSLKSTL